MGEHEIDVLLNAINVLRSELRATETRLFDRLDTLYREGCSRAGSHADVEARMRVLERDRQRLLGGAAVVAWVGGVVGAGLVWLVDWLTARGAA
jgi:hypothetical protein